MSEVGMFPNDCTKFTSTCNSAKGATYTNLQQNPRGIQAWPTFTPLKRQVITNSYKWESNYSPHLIKINRTSSSISWGPPLTPNSTGPTKQTLSSGYRIGSLWQLNQLRTPQGSQQHFPKTLMSGVWWNTLHLPSPVYRDCNAYIYKVHCSCSARLPRQHLLNLWPPPVRST